MATTTTTTGFKVPCPHCGAVEGLIVQAHDLGVVCRECDAEVTAADLRRLIDDARRLLAWLDAASTF